MRIHTSKIKATVAFMLALCLSMAFLFPAASALVLANHTHVCCGEQYKDNDADVRECCIICVNHYRVKERTPPLCGRATNGLPAAVEPPLLRPFAEISFLEIPFSTLTSLNVRLNN